VLLRLGLGRLLGLSLLLVSLLTYHSYTRHPVLGRWSYPFFAALLAVVGLWLAMLVSTWRRVHVRTHTPGPVASAALLDLGVLSWGVAYLLSALETPPAAARILDLDFFGSAIPAAALLEWIALLAIALAGGIVVGRRLPARYANPALSCGAVICLALVGEGVARVKAVVAPATEGFPTASGALWYRRHVRLNRDGFRDRPHAVSPEAGSHRLLAIGDSYAFGVGIERLEDRFGEQLGAMLATGTGERWEVINASQGDLHTLQEIALLQRVLPCGPDVIVLVYVFNDIDYLRPVTERTVLTEAPRTLLQRLHPVRLLFENSYLFQELYVRVRLLGWRRAAQAGDLVDAYADSALLARHIDDLGRFVSLARQTGAVVGIVPFDHAVTLSAAIRRRYQTFVSRARTGGLPIWSLDGAFNGVEFSQLTVNSLDGHPNPLANRLAAAAVVEQVTAARRRERPGSRPPRRGARAAP
jgi:hypothetical protein